MERNLSKIHKLQWCTIQWRNEQQLEYIRRCKTNFGYVTFENKPRSGILNKFSSFKGGCFLFEKKLKQDLGHASRLSYLFAMIWFCFLSLSDHSHWILSVDICELLKNLFIFMPFLAPFVCLSRSARCQSPLSPHNTPFPSLGSCMQPLPP